MQTRSPHVHSIRWKMPLGLLLLATIALAQTDEWNAPARAARKKNPLVVDAETIAVGREIYTKQCAACHGDKGRGDGPIAPHLDPSPRDFAATSVAKQTDGALFWKIGEGHKPMPSFNMQMSEDGRWHVVCYLREVAREASTTQPATQP
jgi:mono/diheme cytochrome c family protein